MATPGESDFGFSGEGLEGLGMDVIMGEEDGFMYGNATEVVGFQRPGMSGSDSSSTTSSSSNGPSASPRKENREPTMEQRRTASSVSSMSPENAESSKRPAGSKKAKTVSGGHLKVRKEKLGERITALQQLVSPFGKTDTASVLHEAMGYIRFLHDQVQVLSSPYLQRISSNQHPEGGGEGVEELRYDLRSRGLCLVPVACTLHVASSNGADLWAPAVARNSGSSSRS